MRVPMESKTLQDCFLNLEMVDDGDQEPASREVVGLENTLLENPLSMESQKGFSSTPFWAQGDAKAQTVLGQPSMIAVGQPSRRAEPVARKPFRRAGVINDKTSRRAEPVASKQLRRAELTYGKPSRRAEPAADQPSSSAENNDDEASKVCITVEDAPINLTTSDVLWLNIINAGQMRKISWLSFLIIPVSVCANIWTEYASFAVACHNVMGEMAFLFYVPYVAVLLLINVLFIWGAIRDSGKVKVSDQLMWSEFNTWRRCVICRMRVPPVARHCFFCGFCVWERDHHCFAMGRCVGRNNFWLFHLVVFMTIVAIILGAIVKIINNYLIDECELCLRFVGIYFVPCLILTVVCLISRRHRSKLKEKFPNYVK